MAKNDKNSNNSWFDVEVQQTIDNDSFVSDANHPSSIDGPIIEDAEVVYEEDPNQTIIDKIKYLISTINTKVLIIFVALFLIVLVVIIAVLMYFAKVNSSYTADIIAPDVIYMGESSTVYVTAAGKNNLENTVTTFESDDENIAAFYSKKVEGKEAENVLTPVQEGRTTIRIKSKLGSRKLANYESELVVCPAFTPDLLLTKSISIIAKDTYKLPVDFGEKECSDGITYDSKDTNIMTIDEKGVINAIAPGTTALVIKKDTKIMEIPVTVTTTYIPMTSFNVIPDKVQLVPKQNIRLKVEYAPLDATTSKIRFVSSDSDIVTVSSGGLVTGIAPGNAKITVATPSISGVKIVEVVVNEATSSGGSGVTEINLNKSDVNLVEGNSEKITANIVPDDQANKKLKWVSSDTTIATVDKNGVIYAVGEGHCMVTVSTDNNVSRIINVTVVKMKTPVITSSDGIPSNGWHKASYVLNFSGSEENSIYYYGTSPEGIEQTGAQVTISNDGSITYYVQACKNVCTKKCDKKDKSKCEKVCKKGVCSPASSYVSRVDLVKPQVLNVVTTSGRGPVLAQITLKDDNSGVQKWCITNNDQYINCKWNTLPTPQNNPVIPYTVNESGAYYVFAMDAAGNISDNYRFRADIL